MFRRLTLALAAGLGVLTAPLIATSATAGSPYWEPDYPYLIDTAEELMAIKVRDATPDEVRPAMGSYVNYYPHIEHNHDEYTVLIWRTEGATLRFENQPIEPGLYKLGIGQKISGFVTVWPDRGYRSMNYDHESGIAIWGPPLTDRPESNSSILVLDDLGRQHSYLGWRVFREDLVVVGDWDGDGIDTPAIRAAGTNVFSLSDSINGWMPRDIAYGKATDAVYVGDWDGDGRDSLAVRRGNVFYLSNQLNGGEADTVTAYGRPDDEVLVGRWTPSASDTPSVRRGNKFYIKHDFSGGEADIVTAYGRAEDVVLIGDWDGDGTDSPSIRRNNTFYIKNSFSGGDADLVFTEGSSDEVALVGDFTGSGKDTIALHRRDYNRPS